MVVYLKSVVSEWFSVLCFTDSRNLNPLEANLILHHARFLRLPNIPLDVCDQSSLRMFVRLRYGSGIAPLWVETHAPIRFARSFIR